MKIAINHTNSNTTYMIKLTLLTTFKRNIMSTNWLRFSTKPGLLLKAWSQNELGIRITWGAYLNTGVPPSEFLIQ